MLWVIPLLTQMICWGLFLMSIPFWFLPAELRLMASRWGQPGFCPPARAACLGPGISPDLLIASPLHGGLNTQIKWQLFFLSVFLILKEACWKKNLHLGFFCFPPFSWTNGLQRQQPQRLSWKLFQWLLKNTASKRLSTQNIKGKSYI